VLLINLAVLLCGFSQFVCTKARRVLTVFEECNSYHFHNPLLIQNAISCNAVTPPARFNTQYNTSHIKTLTVHTITEISEKNALKMIHHPKNTNKISEQVFKTLSL
jgi:hypothetical protein